MKNLDGKLKIIAEIGVNHNNNREIGKKLVHEAKKAGAHSVKFQTFKAEKLFAKCPTKYEDADYEKEKS